jgi:hypothetical protein
MDGSYALVAGAAFLAGIANAIAGGGSLLSFPALVAAGLPAVAASVTNTVALCPGYLGATVAQRAQLRGQGRRVAALAPLSVAGGIGGALLLLGTGEKAFDVVVPWLLLFAAVLLALQDRIKRALGGEHGGAGRGRVAAVGVAVAAAAVYGGYFGAGMGVIVLAALAVAVDDDLVRVNALKQVVSLSTNVAAAILFAFSSRIDWGYAAAMAVASLAGGALGGRIASRVEPSLLRVVVVTVALAVSGYYFVKWLA